MFMHTLLPFVWLRAWHVLCMFCLCSVYVPVMFVYVSFMFRLSSLYVSFMFHLHVVYAPGSSLLTTSVAPRLSFAFLTMSFFFTMLVNDVYESVATLVCFACRALRLGSFLGKSAYFLKFNHKLCSPKEDQQLYSC